MRYETMTDQHMSMSNVQDDTGFKRRDYELESAGVGLPVRTDDEAFLVLILSS